MASQVLGEQREAGLLGSKEGFMEEEVLGLRVT